MGGKFAMAREARTDAKNLISAKLASQHLRSTSVGWCSDLRTWDIGVFNDVSDLPFKVTPPARVILNEYVLIDGQRKFGMNVIREGNEEHPLDQC